MPKKRPSRDDRTPPASTNRAAYPQPLSGTVAVVAGATRGAGRGVARALGEAGATVYCTGRSVPGKPSPYGRPETIDETAQMIKAVGGTAIPVQIDHGIESQVEALFGEIDREHGRASMCSSTASRVRSR